MNITFSLLYFISFVTKVFSFNEFKYAIVDFDFMLKKPDSRLVTMAALLVLASEFLLAVCFSMNILVRTAYIISIIQLLIFLFLFLRVFRLNKEVKCNCFGKNEHKTNVKLAILRNTLLLIASLFGAVFSSNVAGISDVTTGILLVSIALIYQILLELRVLLRLFNKDEYNV